MFCSRLPLLCVKPPRLDTFVLPTRAFRSRTIALRWRGVSWVPSADFLEVAYDSCSGTHEDPVLKLGVDGRFLEAQSTFGGHERKAHTPQEWNTPRETEMSKNDAGVVLHFSLSQNCTWHHVNNQETVRYHVRTARRSELVSTTAGSADRRQQWRSTSRPQQKQQVKGKRLNSSRTQTRSQHPDRAARLRRDAHRNRPVPPSLRQNVLQAPSCRSSPDPTRD